MGLEKYAYIAERGRTGGGASVPIRPEVADEAAQAAVRPLITKKPDAATEDVGFSILDLHPATRILRRAMLPAGSDPTDQMQKAASRAFLKSATLGYWDPDPTYKPESGVEKAQDVIGNLAGYALPLSGAGKAVKAAGLAGSLGKKLAGEAVVGAVTGAARKPEEGESRVVNAVTDAALFPGMTLAMKGAGSLARKLKNAIAPDLSLASVGEKLADMMPNRFGQRLREEMVDQLAPLRDFEAPLAKSGAVPKEESAYIAGRQFSGWMGKAENRLSQLSDIIHDVQKTDSTLHNTLGRLSPKVRQQRNDFSEYLKLHRMIERSSRGIANPGGETAETALGKLREMAAKTGRQVDDAGRIAGMEENAQRIYKYGDDLLRESVDAGIISKDSYAAIKAKNERYVPFDVLEYIGDQAGNMPRGRKAFSVASQDIVKSMEGTEKEVADPLEALIRKTYKTVNLIERNKVARKFVNLRNAGGEFQQMIVPLQDEALHTEKAIGRVQGSLARVTERIARRDAIQAEIDGLHGQIDEMRGVVPRARALVREEAVGKVAIEPGKSAIETELPNAPRFKAGKMQTPRMRQFWKTEIGKVEQQLAAERQVSTDYHPYLQELRDELSLRLEEPDILAAVRKNGGLSIQKETGGGQWKAMKGELKRLSFKELGRGDILRKDGKSLDRMHQALVEEGVISPEASLSDIVEKIEDAVRAGKPEFSAADLSLVDRILQGKVVSKSQAGRLQKLIEWAKSKADEFELKYGEMPKGEQLQHLEVAKAAFEKEAAVPVAAKPIYAKIKGLEQKLAQYRTESDQAQGALFDEIKGLVRSKDMTIREARDLLRQAEGNLASQAVDLEAARAKGAITTAIAKKEGRLRSGAFRGIDQKKTDLEAFLDKLEAGEVQFKTRNVTPPAGFGVVSAFEDGIRRDYAVPQPIADALKRMNEHSAGIVAQLGRWQAAPLRAGATSLNVAFMATNLIRDYQTAKLTSKYGFNVVSWVRGFAHAIKKDDVFRQFMESGGALSGLYGQTTHVKQSLKEISGSKLGKFVKTVTNPLALIRYVGEAVENAPRIGVMQRALAKGESLMGAGYAARNSTVDFSRAGTVMRVANMFIPFLNARMQGNLNVFKGIVHHPLKASLVMSYMITAPVIAAYYLNTRAYGDLYDDVPQYIKDNFFVLITGSEETENGVEPKMITIPKGDVGRIVGNPLENFLAYLDKKDTKSVDQLALQIVSNISPIDFEKNGKFDAGMAMGGVLPPAAKAAAEMATGKSFFTGLPIEPRTIKGVPTERIPAEERVTEKTSPAAVVLGKKIGASPIMIDNLIGGMFGGLGRQLADPKKFITDPGSRFVRTKGGGVKQKQHVILDEVEQKYGGAKFERNTEAEKLYDEMKAMKPADANAKFREVARSDRAMAKRIKDLRTSETMDLDDVERRLSSTEVKSGERAEKIYRIVMGMKTNRVRNDYVKNLMKKKIVTPQVMGQLRQLIKQGA